jgi:hypothetical protein
MSVGGGKHDKGEEKRGDEMEKIMGKLKNRKLK